MSAPKDLTASQVIDALEKFWETHGWCRYSTARTADGTICSEKHPDARQWCAIGALALVYGDRYPLALAPLRRALFTSGKDRVSDVNDECTSAAEVIAQLRRAAQP